MDDHIPFIEFGDEDIAEIDGPDAIVRFVQADVKALECCGNEEQFVFESEGSCSGYVFDQEVSWIFDSW